MDILQTLVKRKVIAKQAADQVKKDLSSSPKTAEELLLERKLVSEDVLFEEKGEALNIPLKAPKAEDIPSSVLELIPEDSAAYYKMVPLSRREDTVEVGMVYPEDDKAKEALNFLSRQGNVAFEPALISLSAFEDIMRFRRSQRNEVGEALQELEGEIQDSKGKAESEQFSRLVEEAPITKMVAVILRNAVEGKASDIHIEPMKDKLRVRFRLLGDLYSSLFLPQRVHQAVVARIKILSSLKIDEQRIPQDGRFSALIEQKSVDFRVSTFPTAAGEKVAIRVLDPETGLRSFEELGLESSSLKKVESALSRPFGLSLVTGPTGSGKTTTLYAMLQTLNRDAVNIVSLEDPVEYLVSGVNQSQVRPEIHYDFASGLRQVLRQDPDVIMVGEIRDKETAGLAVHAALTGHIVLSTLHTNNALGVIPRLLDMGVDRYLLPATISVAVSQRLVRRLCDACKERKEPAKEMRELIMKEVRDMQNMKEAVVQSAIADNGTSLALFVPKGCKECGNAGYIGRVGIFEVLEMTDELSNIVLQDPSESAIGQEAVRQGMVTMRQDGILKVLEGVTTIEEVIRVSEE